MMGICVGGNLWPVCYHWAVVRHLASRNVWVVIVIRILMRMMRHGVGKVSIVVGVIRTGVSKSPGVKPSTIITWIIPWIIQI